MEIEQRRARIDGAMIAYQVAGSGQPLVLLHGLAGSGRWWRWNMAALARRYRVYVVDLVGFGESARGHRFLLGEAASHLGEWAGQLGLGRARWIGHSMGGYIAAELAADAPEHVGQLVLVDAAILLRRRGVLQHTPALARSFWYVPLRFMPTLFGDTLRAGPLTLWNAAGELLSRDLRQKLGRIGAPTLLVWGEHDALVPLEIGRELQHAIPGSRLATLGGAGHMPMLEQPERFNRLLLDFLL